MSSKKTVVALAAVVLIVTIMACSAGINLPGGATPTIKTTPLPATAEARDELFKPFWEAWQIVHDQYVDQPVDDVTLMRGAIKGMMDSLGDQHTTYIFPSFNIRELSV